MQILSIGPDPNSLCLAIFPDGATVIISETESQFEDSLFEDFDDSASFEYIQM